MAPPVSRHLQGDWLSSYWAGFMSPHQHSRIRNTGVPLDLLKVGGGGGGSVSRAASRPEAA